MGLPKESLSKAHILIDAVAKEQQPTVAREDRSWMTRNPAEASAAPKLVVPIRILS